MEHAKHFYELTLATLSDTIVSLSDREVLEDIASVWKLILMIDDIDHASTASTHSISIGLSWLEWHAEQFEPQLPVEAMSLYSLVRRGWTEAALARINNEVDRKILATILDSSTRKGEVVKAAITAYDHGGRGEILSLVSGVGMEQFGDNMTVGYEQMWQLLWGMKQVAMVQQTEEEMTNYYAQFAEFATTVIDPVKRLILLIQAGLLFNVPIDQLMTEVILQGSTSLAVDNNTVHSFLGYLGVYLRGTQSLFDPQVSELVDELVEHQIMSFFAAKGARIGQGAMGAGFLGEHIVAIWGLDRRVRVWTGCLVEMAASANAPSAAVGSGALVSELIACEQEYSSVAAVIRGVIDETLELNHEGSGYIELAINILAQGTLLSLRKFVCVDRSPYGVFEELLEKLAIGLLRRGDWRGVESFYAVVSRSLDVAVVIEGGGLNGGGWLKLAELCADVEGLQNTEEVVIRLGLERVQADIECHTAEQVQALARAVEFVLRKLVTNLRRVENGRREVVALVDKCEESQWLSDVLGESRWVSLGELCDRALAS
jgi:hypothetical protein